MSLLFLMLRSSGIMKLRMRMASLRRRYDPLYRWRQRRRADAAERENAPYERMEVGYWQPRILGLEETLRAVIDKRLSLARFGDGEFELMAGRSMSFELANADLGRRLREVLERPVAKCLNCVPNVFGPLERYRQDDRVYWRRVAVWMRPVLRNCLGSAGENDYVFGDTQVSRAYLGVWNGRSAHRIFELWKELFAGKRILIVEGRFSRLGIGNDLFGGANAIARIWCPPVGAYAHYDEILSEIRAHAADYDLVVLALGATATLLSYDLSKEGVWAVDTGHLDVEYMWMKMGAKEKVAIPNRYVNEAVDGHEMQSTSDEEKKYNVVAMIGCE